MNDIRKYTRARLAGLAACGLLLSPSSARSSASSDSLEAPPRLESYADIDRALDGTWLIPPGATWRWFPGIAQPSELEEWAEEEYDDSSWREGPSPFRYGVPGDGTLVEEMGQGVTSVYLRCGLDVPDLGRYERIVLEVPVDDGFVFYFNGEETERRGSGDPLEIPGAAWTSSTQRDVTTQPVPVSDLTRTIVSGYNQLAIHAYVHAEDAGTFEVHPSVRAEYRRTQELDAERFDTLAGLIESSDLPQRETLLAYLEGRHAQRQGEPASADAHFVRLVELDAASPIVWTRRVECHRARGTLAELDAECRERMAADPGIAMLEAWTRFSLEDLRRTPDEVAAALPEELAPPADTYLDDVRWLATTLAGTGVLRLDCGQARDRQVDGTSWSRDRFFARGTSARSTLSDGTTPRDWGAERSVRIASRSLEENVPTYRIPLPEGDYELRLTFVGNDGEECEAGKALFDVLVEGSVVMQDYDPVVEAGRRGLDQHAFPVRVDDGFLDVDLRKGAELDPWIAAIELRPYAPEAFADHAAAWVAALEAPSPFALEQLGIALARSDEPLSALAVLEEAEALPGFQPTGARRLSELRVQLLPHLPTFATADDLARNHAALCTRRMEEIQAAAGESPVLATYLTGLLHEHAGRFEEALGPFEELVGSRVEDPRPYVHMARCLVAAGLPDHALDILEEGSAVGVEATPEWLTLWIALELEVRGREPWDIIAELAQGDVPEELVVVATSEHVSRPWHLSLAEPPSTSWSRTTFDPSPWPVESGVLGSGAPAGVVPRGLWNTDSMYAQRAFHLARPALLYPHLSVLVDGAVNTYVNGTALGFVGATTRDYIRMPARKGTWLEGENVIGMHAFSQTGPSAADVGIVQPVGDLVRIWRELNEDGALRLNCGGPEVIAADGTRWSADRFFGWGPAVARGEDEPWIEIAGTEDDVLYHTMRAFHDDVISTWYQIPVPPGRYRVRMHFAEIEDGKAEGDRTFIVAIEKKPVLKAHDIVACVGFASADVHEVETEVKDGWLDLRLADLDHLSVISALEVEPIAE